MHEIKLRRACRILRGEGPGGERQQVERRLVALAGNEEVVAALPVKGCFRGALDGIRRAEPAASEGRRRGRRAAQGFGQQIVLRHVGGRIAFKNNRRAVPVAAVFCQGGDFIQPLIAFLVRQPHDLKRTVPLHGPRGVIIDALPWP